MRATVDMSESADHRRCGGSSLRLIGCWSRDHVQLYRQYTLYVYIASYFQLTLSRKLQLLGHTALLSEIIFFSPTLRRLLRASGDGGSILAAGELTNEFF
ncbi:hypothetical protein EVAR_19694_1 [Eumeta japonica]|uniref:Uncharacterized protein n=1 Tax=Eumeta variegata TaxID=151549 RepID=A0A4C1V3L4_EUMVA|nr:hypothetical protein EVAR_19694_1 [Eumeta japonica]